MTQEERELLSKQCQTLKELKDATQEYINTLEKLDQSMYIVRLSIKRAKTILIGSIVALKQLRDKL